MEELDKKTISVSTFYTENKKRLKLKVVTEKGSFQRTIGDKNLHRPGLALTGFMNDFEYQRIQVFGVIEMAYLKTLPPANQEEALERVFQFAIPCLVVTGRKRPSSRFLECAERHGITVFTTPCEATEVVQVLGDYLDEKFAPSTTIHGDLVDVYGIGILITGRSGIGKSEVALDLVSRGHRLVADDVIQTIRRTEGILIGRGNETLLYHMEIRGVGIIDVQAIFGIRAVRRQKRVEVQVELVDWDENQEHERLGIKDIFSEILSEKIPLVRLPIYPGKSISVIVEVIALNQLLKIYGHHSAKRFDRKITRKLQSRLEAVQKYLEHDYE